MLMLDAAAIASALSYPRLVDVMADTFRRGVVAPPRHHHTIHLDERPDATLLLMPAWSRAAPGSEAAGRYLGIKSVSVFPDAARYAKPSVQGLYMLFDTEAGTPLAVMDAAALTAWRTAAASALAARHLARADAARLLMIGSGSLASYLIRAHASVRQIRRVTIWSRTRANAETMAARLAREAFTVAVTDDVAAAVGAADIVTCATLAIEPIVRGAWLKPGTHLDLVGSFRPTMREVDDDAVARAAVYIDTPGALHETGDLLGPIRAGVLKEADIRGDLAGLVRGAVAGRRNADEITLFKSVGAAIEDLGAAIEVYERTLAIPVIPGERSETRDPGAAINAVAPGSQPVCGGRDDRAAGG
jgi:ornithine cyclodeaminase